MTPPPLFRYSIEKSMMGFILRTELDWYVRPTYEEAMALMTQLRAEFEEEWKANDHHTQF